MYNYLIHSIWMQTFAIEKLLCSSAPAKVPLDWQFPPLNSHVHFILSHFFNNFIVSEFFNIKDDTASNCVSVTHNTIKPNLQLNVCEYKYNCLPDCRHLLKHLSCLIETCDLQWALQLLQMRRVMRFPGQRRLPTTLSTHTYIKTTFTLIPDLWLPYALNHALKYPDKVNFCKK